MTLVYDLLILAGIRLAARRLQELARRVTAVIIPVIRRSIEYLWPIVRRLAALLAQSREEGRDMNAGVILTAFVRSLGAGVEKDSLA